MPKFSQTLDINNHIRKHNTFFAIDSIILNIKKEDCLAFYYQMVHVRLLFSICHLQFPNPHLEKPKFKK